ncbi:MAG: cobyrinate a,c-diamide synthase [Chlamydiales bacterium]
MAYFSKKGYRVQPYKHGPDFIDPGYHRAATGNESINLDYWLMSEDEIIQKFNLLLQNADIGIVEGMGAIYDGENGTGKGCGAELAYLLSIPVILVIDIFGMTRSVNALLQGFLQFDSKVEIAGIVFNRAGSQKHYEMVIDSLLPEFQSLSLGYLQYFPNTNIPERHLGLLTIDENENFKKILDIYLCEAKKTLEFDELIERFPPAKKSYYEVKKSNSSSHVTIGVAKDKAFCFYYRQNLDFLEKSGANIVYFSPTYDSSLPQEIDGLYFGGGYPEVFAQQLSENTTLKSEILKHANLGMPIYAECGGFVYLCDQILFDDETSYSMTGLFPYSIRWDKRFLAIRYVNIKTTQDTIFGPKGLLMKGQEFHQTRIVTESWNPEYCYEVTSSTNEKFSEGFYTKNALGSYIHLYFPSAPKLAENFILKCLEYKENNCDIQKI